MVFEPVDSDAMNACLYEKLSLCVSLDDEVRFDDRKHQRPVRAWPLATVHKRTIEREARGANHGRGFRRPFVRSDGANRPFEECLRLVLSLARIQNG